MRAIRRPALPLLVLLVTLLFAAGGCASSGKQRSALERAQVAWSSAIRWNDVEGAWQLVDPEVRAERPMGELAFARYAQLQVTGYRELGAQADPAEALREIEVRVVNRHSMAERTLRHTERWRWDAAAGTWWNVSGLPDFWAGE
ncbi:hypothetical protein [Luteimonas sp. FCS-9]|uniref:hypothetical protein n=1 Tax=Luteimonas sp. FCS-9 TaxID=1547516 RepID=UPI00063EC579|nr:hypothetical protein [Luteimonas sp. FCS-9]KLI99933.1 hypothetical protein WQ56_11155 [Luteimonas sp. FCS-9]